MWKWVALGVVLAVTLLTLTRVQPTEVQEIAPRPLDGALAAELKQLRQLLAEQQAASKRQSELVAQLKRELAGMDTAAPSSIASDDSAAADDDEEGDEPPSPASVVAAAAEREAASAAEVAAAEAKALSRCTENDVPILKLLREPCRAGFHGYDCEERWGLSDTFLPDATRWLREWNASARSVTNCQRGYFDAFAHRLTLAHWEVCAARAGVRAPAACLAAR